LCQAIVSPFGPLGDVPLDHGLCQNGTTWAATDAAAAGLVLGTPSPGRGRGEKSPRLGSGVFLGEKLEYDWMGWNTIHMYDREIFDTTIVRNHIQTYIHILS